MRYFDLLLPVPLPGLFTYHAAEPVASRLAPGVRVVVAFGGSKTYVGVVWQERGAAPEFQTKPVLSVLDAAPSVLDTQRRLWQWVADYYMSALGDVMKAALPAPLRSTETPRRRMETVVELGDKLRTEAAMHIALTALARAPKQRDTLAAYLALSRWAETDGDTPPAHIAPVTREELMNEAHATAAVVRQLQERGFLRLSEREARPAEPPQVQAAGITKTLAPAQQTALDSVRQQFAAKNVVLLHGVTSGGKTELYIRLIDEALRRGEQALFLMPEIALTVQMTTRLGRVFGSRLAIYHSKYTDAERLRIWRRQLSADPYGVVLGARSALFLPFQRLGLVVVDEEHETSYKQYDPAPRYHARSAAIVLAAMHGAKTLLGSATPSVESLRNAQTGKYGYVRLTQRYAAQPLPEVLVADVKDLRRRKLMQGLFSPDLLTAIRQTIDAGRQVILFQNRRGYAPAVECRTCGWTPRCHNCDVSLVYHRSAGQMICHYCGATYPVPDRCPACGEQHLRERGAGTEKIEDILHSLLPDVRIARMDLDTTHTLGGYERLIADFSAGRTQVLVGTQMVTKGLDFAGVGLVGVLDADGMLNAPDFRATERAFSMLTQVAGRAGRAGARGRVVVQTRDAQGALLGCVRRSDVRTYYNMVLAERREFRYPPFTHLTYAYVKHAREDVADDAARVLARAMGEALAGRVLGPFAPAVARVSRLYVRQLTVKAEPELPWQQVRAALWQCRAQVMARKEFAAAQIYFDVDPQ